MRRFARVRAEIEEQPDSADAIYWLITLSAGEHAARARIAWAREALELLDRSDADVAQREPERSAQRRPESAGDVRNGQERAGDFPTPA